jgi:hypothetical protein
MSRAQSPGFRSKGEVAQFASLKKSESLVAHAPVEPPHWHAVQLRWSLMAV